MAAGLPPDCPLRLLQRPTFPLPSKIEANGFGPLYVALPMALAAGADDMVRRAETLWQRGLSDQRLP